MRLWEDTPISFPGLGIENIDPPEGFYLFGSDFQVKFYGVIIALGLFLAVIYCMKRAKAFGGGDLDMQRIDMGIALCHFDRTAAEAGLQPRFALSDPGLCADGMEYIASYIM